MIDYMVSTGITDMELGYKMLNFDQLTEAAKRQALKETKELKEKRKASFTESTDQPGEITPPSIKSKAKTYHALGKEGLAAMRAKGEFSHFED